MSDLVGQSLDKYRIVARIGSGGMGNVYQAYQPGLDRHVAIKTLHGHLADKEGFVRRFEREGAALARLRHPNIVQVYDFEAQEDLCYLVMEFIEGPTLEARLHAYIEDGHVYSPEELLPILTDLAGAIDYAHARGMVHRDIKPGNIMFTADNQPVLTDFGIAHILGSPRSTVTGAIGGTPAYMSPEQCRGERPDGRSDIYALGATCYEALTGRVPFVADSPVGVIMKHLTDAPLPPCEINPNLTPQIDLMILKALNKDPDDRYQSAVEMAEALREALHQPFNAALTSLPAPASVAPLTLPLRPRPAVPFQAPPDKPQFVGRIDALSDLIAALTSDSESQPCCIVGMGGVGKTTLAVHLAHMLHDHFTDGVLWANTATSEPLAVLDSWARAFDCDYSGLPDLESRAAAMRGLLADKRVLVVLDDVRSAEHARSLLPSGPQCAVLLTTRDVEIGVSLGAQLYPLSGLTLADCLQLMSYIVGEERVASEAACADEICGLLGNLPLAVEIASQRLASRRRWQLDDLADRLRDEGSRLRELRTHDQEVRVSFALSWEMLDDDLRRSFALLGVFEGRPFTPAAFATVAELDRRVASDHLYELEALSLVSEEGRVHYRQHPLLADFSREHLGTDHRASALMSWYYLAYATEYEQDYKTLEIEWENMLSGMRTAHELKIWQMVVDYAEALTPAWFARGRYTDARRGYEWAHTAADALNDQDAIGLCLNRWGQACIEQSDYEEAEKHLLHSLEVCQGSNCERNSASAQYQLGRIAIEQAAFDKAQELLEKSRNTRERLGDRAGVAEVLFRLARIRFYQDALDEAKRLGSSAFAIQQSEGDKLGCVRTLHELANIALAREDHISAEEYCRRALELCKETDEQSELSLVLYTLSDVFRQRGELELARDYAQESLALLNRVGDRKSQAQVLYHLSLVHSDMQNYDAAMQAGTHSLELCQALSDAWGTVFVLRRLGDILTLQNRPDQAHQVWCQALDLAEELKHPLSEALREYVGISGSSQAS